MDSKNKGGRKRSYKDIDFLNTLSEIPQTTAQIKDTIQKLNGYDKIIHDTILKTLLRLSNDPDTGVIKNEIKAASRTGKMYLWSITEAGIKKRDEEQENTQ